MSNTPISFNWDSLTEEEEKKITSAADAGRIPELPTDYLLQYAAEDTDSTFLFYREILRPALDRFTAYDEFHQEYHMNLVEQIAIQQLHGVQLDMHRFHACRELWTQKRWEAERAIFQNDKVWRGINHFHDLLREALEKEEPPEFKEKKETVEPIRYKKNGDLNPNWEKWYEKTQELPEVNPKWEAWRAAVSKLEDLMVTYDQLSEAEIRENKLFSLTSGDNLRWLFYDYLKFPVKVLTENENNPRPAVNDQALKGFGEIGKLFEDLNEANKMLQFIASLETASNMETGVYHPHLKVPGTFTGRLSGSGGFNWQNPPKSREFLEIFAPREGCGLLDWDACYSADTKVLTKGGWKFFNEISLDTQVWQVDAQTLKGSWTNPLRVIWKPYTGNMYSIGNRRGELRVTEGHKMLFVGQQDVKRKRGKRYIQNIECPVRSTFSLPLASRGAVSSASYTKHDLWMVCMIQADACLYNQTRPTPKFCIEVSKPRKREKVRELLGRPGATICPPRGAQTMETEKWFSIDYRSPLLSYTKEKLFDLSSLGEEYAEDFLEALSFWDGSVTKNNSVVYFCMQQKHNVEEVQKYFVRCGYEAKITKDGTTVHIHKPPVGGIEAIRIRPCDVKKEEVRDEFVGCVTVETGFILVQRGGQTFVCGNCSLEPTVLAELSRDPGLLSVYGPKASPYADIYLLVGNSFPGIGEIFRAAGYDPNNPSEEAVKRCKTEHKDLRGVCKTLKLSADYGCGAKKWHTTLCLDGFNYTLDQCYTFHKAFWNLFKAIKKWEAAQLTAWEKNGGWLIDGLGLPCCVSGLYTRDLTNRIIQRTGHEVLMMYQKTVTDLFRERGIRHTPWCYDYHDQMIMEIDASQREEANELMGKEAFIRLNKLLQNGTTVVELKGSGGIVKNLADSKLGG